MRVTEEQADAWLQELTKGIRRCYAANDSLRAHATEIELLALRSARSWSSSTSGRRASNGGHRAEEVATDYVLFFIGRASGRVRLAGCTRRLRRDLPQRGHPDREDAGALAKGECDPRALRPHRPLRVSRLAVILTPRACGPGLSRSPHPREAASRDRPAAAEPRDRSRATSLRRDPPARPTRRPHRRVLPSSRLMCDGDIGAPSGRSIGGVSGTATLGVLGCVCAGEVARW